MNTISPYLRVVAGFFAGMCTWLAIASLVQRWGARPLDHAVPSTSELPGVAAVRAEGREAMHALAERRSAAQSAQATTRGPRSSVRPTKSSGTTTPPSVDGLRLRWNTRS
ncbi:hypothetical protein RE9431_12950 [Prescottella equi]|nr:hypothetical protein RE9431_12950 [Prescottella equi]BCN72693.1 hypothetical protein RE0327_12920 [Prescottella equi]